MAESGIDAARTAAIAGRSIRRLPCKAVRRRQFAWTGCGVIRQMRVTVEPSTPEALLGLRLQIAFDRAELPSVDVPVGYFFGNAYAEGGKEKIQHRRGVGQAAERFDEI